MKNKSLDFIWSIAWWLEEDKAWFVEGMNNVLYNIDLATGECDRISVIPDTGQWTYRLNPYCLKCGRDIFCIPGYGKSIWIYNLDDSTFTEVEIDKPYRHYFGSHFWRIGDIIYLVAIDWNKVIELSISRRTITNYYTLCENDSVKRSIFVDNKIYAVSSEFGRIYQFNTITKEISVYTPPHFDKKLFAICFDGEKFWLSGYQKEIYIWDKEKNGITTINLFSQYSADCITDSNDCHIFNFSVFVGGYIWFIPTLKGNIIYVNKQTFETYVFEINDEERKDVLLDKPYGIPNYLLEYVREDRYIGLFSAKNRRIFEIDTKQLSYQWMNYCFSDKCLIQYSEECKGIYYEKKEDLLQIRAYGMNINSKGSKLISTNSIGRDIHIRIKGEDA